MKTADLTGPTLDWAVAKADQPVYSDAALIRSLTASANGIGIEWEAFSPSTDWAQGGPILDREAPWVRESAAASPAIAHLVTPDKKWFAYASRRYDGGDFSCYYGETFLIAAMRCYVASKLGAEVDIPKELL